MGAVLALTREHRAMAELPALLGADPWAAASQSARHEAELRETLVKPLADLVRAGGSINKAAALFAGKVAAGLMSPETARAVRLLDAAGLSVPTLKRWLSAYLKDGKAGLLPQYTGRKRQERGWEARAVQLYNLPSKPGFADVSMRLCQEGFADVTESRVKRYLKSLPATLGKDSPARIGVALHKLTRRHFTRRHLDEVLVGEIYAGDGHTADCYVAHPNTGKPYRPELTVFIDIKAKFVPGWWCSESESAVSTMFALSHAMQAHNHVPAWVYIDRGAGYKAKLLSDESTGFYSRMDIGVIGALPGNPHGKGWIERFFRTVRDKHDKFFAGGQVYCGDDMAPEINRRLSADLAMGRRELPSLRQYIASLTAWLEQYHDTPMDSLGGRTPYQVWAELTPVPVGSDVSMIARPAKECTVSHQEVRLHNRHYYHENLALYDGHKVDVEYDLHNDQCVWVYDKKGRFIAMAKFTGSIGVLPTSRLEEGRERRLKGQIKRLEKKAQEAIGRRRDAIDAGDQLSGIEGLQGQVIALPTPDSPSTPASPPAQDGGDDFDIDLLNWSDPT